MLYPYAEFPGELSITYSQVIKDSEMKNGEKKFSFILRNQLILDSKKQGIFFLGLKKFIIMTSRLRKQRKILIS